VTIVSNELKKRGLFVSPCGVRCVWLRHDLETFSKRLKGLETRIAQEGIILTEAQMLAMERKKEKKEATGEIETEHPGYLGAQDTYYVGNIKGVGRIYQQTFIDTYSKVAMAKLYDRKNAITAADMVNDKVLPFFEEQQIPLLRILTDRGTEYCGKAEYHEYELYLQISSVNLLVSASLRLIPPFINNNSNRRGIKKRRNVNSLQSSQRNSLSLLLCD
jgi:transposase InsO family protein